MKNVKDMKNLGQYPIWFTGSQRTFCRVVYKDNEKRLFCKWYGQVIELRRDDHGYFFTVEEY